ncbi:hypothetical protein NSQ93_22990 [Bacillus sp. FSL W8-0445]|jgi:hypothetical protein|uniref:Uncharacterized protein n=1 Tax=Bacillus licheniformis TaxID=1402 RepID=A0A8B5YDU9_BACLI|nr:MULTISPECIES: hypothetical protein [Bacillus]AMR09489.1 hypothetical protein AB684_04660 [Bacillus licheniformis]AWV39754.1 hypothetical protein CD200_04740 [Bacillus licheniformis]AZN80447.1 hypothetical protein CXG95_15550 [Bacillus licheniformis]KUL09345.1 hypothetical protein LI17339_13780 [Bacillus licheniformis LMG 17339]KYC79820.1 hypothetical protein B4091_0943 [Bacillus licheniformis]
MMQYTVSKAAVKKAMARLGLSKTQAQNVLPKYAQGASFVWSLESTSGSQSVYDNPREQVRLVIAENGTILDVFPADYALQSPHALSDDALHSLKEATRNALLSKRDEVHRKWCEVEVEVDFHSNSYEIARRRLALIGATSDDELRIKRRLAQLCAENKRLHNERSALRKERTELERALVPYI